jgi:lipid A oxidase
MTVEKHALRATALAGALALVAMTVPAAAEFQFGSYFGWNGSSDSDVTYQNTGTATDFTLHSVPWLGLSFIGDGGAPYYGARATYWGVNSDPHWGVMLDYTHAKVRADPSAIVTATGTTSGSVMVGNVYDVLEYTDGLNLLTVNAMYRMDPIGKFRPYFGVGAGLSIPHTEVLLKGQAASMKTFEYQLDGWAAQVLAGVQVPVWRNISFFTEYKLSYATVQNAPLVDGGTLDGNVLTNHLLAGMAITFGANGN